MTIIDARPFLAIGIAFLAALLVSLSNRYPNIREMWSTIASVTMFGVVISMVGGVLNGVTYEYTLFYLTDTIGLTMRVDPAGMIFAALASMLWIPINFYSIGYMRNNHEGMQTGYFAAFALCIGSTMGIAMASNLLTFFIFYEILTISSYPLVLHERDEEALLASRKYLAYTLVSGQLFLAGTVGVYCIAGTMDFTAGGFLRGDMAPAWVLQLLFVLMIMAGSVKAAVMPLHGWLPAAMVAPTPVSALLHAVAVVKTGAFAVLRVLGFVFGPKLLAELGIADVLAWAAVVTILASSFIALRQDNLKRRLAFSTIGQLSYIVLGGAILTPLAFKGAYLHLVAHAVMKITLFMCAGCIIVRTHLHDISEMDGIGRRMPITMGCFAIASLGIAGTPFIVGFISKWNLAMGAMQAGKPLFIAAWIASAVLAMAYLMPVVRMAFFKPEPIHDPRRYGSISYCMLIPICFTAILAVILGVDPELFPPDFYKLADMASSSITAGWGGGWDD